jgi:hypothetical protein
MGRALLPDLIRFAYIPRKEHANDEDGLQPSSSAQSQEENVLILDFAEMKRKGSKKQEMSVITPREEA